MVTQNPNKAFNQAEAKNKQAFDDARNLLKADVAKNESNKKEFQRRAVYQSAVKQFFQETRESFLINRGVLLAFLEQLRSGVASRADKFNASGGRQELDENSAAISVQLELLYEEMAEALYSEAAMFADNMENLGETLAVEIQEEHGQSLTASLEESAEISAVAKENDQTCSQVAAKLCQHAANDVVHDVMTIMPGVFSQAESHHYCDDQDENDYFKLLADETRHAFQLLPRPEPGQPIENLEKEKHAPERWTHLLEKLLPSMQARSILRWQNSDDPVIRCVANNPALFAKLAPVLSSAYKKPIDEACTMYSRSCSHVERCNVKTRERSINQPRLDPFSIICQMQSGASQLKQALNNNAVTTLRSR